MSAVKEHEQRLETEEPPPFLGLWRNLYLLVVFELGATVAALYALTRWAS